MNRTMKTVVLAGLAALFAAVLAACATTASLPAKHPAEVEGMPVCSDCHTDWRANLDHRQDYINRHGLYAAQQARTCELCHARSFCADCHANKEELKPSDKYKDAPYRSLPHPGNYLSQHRRDGMINPAACFKCHGRKDDWRCRSCHR